MSCATNRASSAFRMLISTLPAVLKVILADVGRNDSRSKQRKEGSRRISIKSQSLAPMMLHSRSPCCRTYAWFKGGMLPLAALSGGESGERIHGRTYC